MRHWWLLGIRNWRTKPGRTAGAVVAIALGVGVVVWVTCAFESVRLALRYQSWLWLGKSHISVESVYGSGGTVYESIADEVKQLSNVDHVTRRLDCPMRIHVMRPEVSANASIDELIVLPGLEIQAVGIDPENEYYFRDYDKDRFEGQLISSGDTDAAMVERQLADGLGLKLGDRFILQSKPSDTWDYDQRKNAIFRVAALLEHRRVAKRQRPIVVAHIDRVRALTHFRDTIPRVTKIDLILKDSSLAATRKSARQVNVLVSRHGQGFVVTSAEGKLAQFKAAEQQTGFVLLLMSSVALFTGFLIIFSTLSIGMAERAGQLGMLRCLGVTRWQVGTLVLLESVPIGLAGIILGVPVGILLTYFTVKIAPDYVGQLEISYTGLIWAVAGGGVTTLMGALLPMFQAFRMSPLEASRPHMRPPRVMLTWLAFIFGTGMIVGHSLMVHLLQPTRWFIPPYGPLYAVAAVLLLYCGYALMTPGLVYVFGQLAVRVVSGLLAVRYRLLNEQVGRALWRSGVICCGLMVGLSLIISLVVHSESLSKGWNFPKDFFEAFVYMSSLIPHERADQIRRIPGIGQSCMINDRISCHIARGKSLFTFAWSRFIASDPDEFFEVAKLKFVHGNKAEAIAKLKKGGYVLVTPEFTLVKKLSYGDKVLIKMKGGLGRYYSFEIAGVVTSPALDVAATYFNKSGMLANQSVLIAMGTMEDVQRIFKVPKDVSMFLINFDLPEVEVVPAEFKEEFPPVIGKAGAFAGMLKRWGPLMPERSIELDEINRRLGSGSGSASSSGRDAISLLGFFEECLTEGVGLVWSKLSPEQRWQSYREELVMHLLARRGGSSVLTYASVRSLKDQIDRELRRATALVSMIPMVALIIAALGVANLMTANVANRSQQIALLRAVGTTKWQVNRLVIGEALVLGTVGCLMGIALGMHAAHSMSVMTKEIWGFKPVFTIPWGWLGLGVGFTMLICLLAGVLPAMRAARNKIIEALQTT